MSRVGLVLRGLIAIPLLFMLALISAAGFQTIEPIYLATRGGNIGGADASVVMLFGSIAFIGLPLVAILWWWVAPLRRDVRQDVRRF